MRADNILNFRHLEFRKKNSSDLIIGHDFIIFDGLTIMLLDLNSLSNTSLHVEEDFRKGKDGFCLGLNRRHQW
jgi:hypothetical protein